MATGLDLVHAELQLINNVHPWYSQLGDRCHPDWTHHCDCSGLQCWALNHVGVGFPCSNSFAMAQYGHQHGLGISREKAATTPGTWFVIGANEGQTDFNNHGHIGLLVGDGVHTIEARGHIAGVGVFTLSSLGWIDYFMYAPGINYKTDAIPPTVTPKRWRGEGEMIPLPQSHTSGTRGAFAVADFTHNRIQLIGGGRLAGDQPDPHGHPGMKYWIPPAKAWVPGMQLVGIGDGRLDAGERENVIVAAYQYPNGDIGTYRATILDHA